MATKTELQNNFPKASGIITVANGDTVSADTENSNNSYGLGRLIDIYNWAISFGADLSLANTFAAISTFTNGIKTGIIESLTGSGDIVVQNGTLKLGDTATNSTAADYQYVQAQISGSGSIQLPVQNGGIQATSFSALSGYFYNIDVSGGSITVTLPASPSNGDHIQIVNYKSTITFTETLTIDGNGNNIDEQTVNQLVNEPQILSFTLEYVASEGGWFSK